MTMCAVMFVSDDSTNDHIGKDILTYLVAQLKTYHVQLYWSCSALKQTTKATYYVFQSIEDFV